MRVIAGEFGGRRLRAPAGRGTRPTASRVREAVFSMLGPVDGLAVLDLFAGSGAMAIEALSRGAAVATLVDHDRLACRTASRNLRELGLEQRARLICRDWKVALRRETDAGRRYGLCVVDPPYDVIDAVARTLRGALLPVLDHDATLVVEHASGLDSPLAGWGEVRTRRYGDSAVSLVRGVGGS